MPSDSAFLENPAKAPERGFPNEAQRGLAEVIGRGDFGGGLFPVEVHLQGRLPGAELALRPRRRSAHGAAHRQNVFQGKLVGSHDLRLRPSLAMRYLTLRFWPNMSCQTCLARHVLLDMSSRAVWRGIFAPSGRAVAGKSLNPSYSSGAGCGGAPAFYGAYFLCAFRPAMRPTRGRISRRARVP